MEKKTKYYQIGSLKKGIRIIDLLSKRGTLSLSEVSGELKLDRSVCHRYLLTLRDLGLVSQPGGSGYRLTLALFEMSMRLINQLEIKKIVRPFMEDMSLEYKETVNLGIKDGDQMVYLDKSESTQLLRAELAIGTRIPIHCTALGKAILAFRPESEQIAFCSGNGFTAYTPRTITSPKTLIKQLTLIRERGFAVDDEEHFLGLRCVAAPLVDHSGFPNYSLSVAGPSSRLSNKRLMGIGSNLKSVCEKISKILGEIRA
jgi:DNA-binding IclR family transcriptional regulator